MRHNKGQTKLNRTGTHRRAMFRNLASALITHERIETTHAKAKALKPEADRLITWAKRGDLHARREAAKHLSDPEALQKLFGELADRFRDRPGGYTRVLRIGRRRGDQGMMALIEWVEREKGSSSATAES